MTARVVVLADPAYDNPDVVHSLLQATYLALRPTTEPPMFLKTANQEGAEKQARAWWLSHGLLIEPSIRSDNRYVVMNSLITDYPDAVLLFGDSNFTRTAAIRCAVYDIEPVHVTE